MFVVSMLFVSPSVSFAAPEVLNIKASLKGRNVVVTYDLQHSESVGIALFCSNNDKFVKASHVTGHVGKFVIPGKQRMIVWEYQDDSVTKQELLNSTLNVVPETAPEVEVKTNPSKRDGKLVIPSSKPDRLKNPTVAAP
jgi:hypothetical protein